MMATSDLLIIYPFQEQLSRRLQLLAKPHLNVLPLDDPAQPLGPQMPVSIGHRQCLVQRLSSGINVKRRNLERAKLKLPLGLIERTAPALKGHGFSPAEKSSKKSRALAPEGLTSGRKVGPTAGGA